MTAHTGKWEGRERSKRNTELFGAALVIVAVIGWFLGKTEGVAMALITNGILLIGAVEINHTRSKVAHDKNGSEG